MTPADPPALSADKLYEELNANIRATDEISFKLIGLVPLVSGAAIGTVLFREAKAEMGLSPGLIILFSLFAAAVTLGLFRWELRNVQHCSHLITLANAMASDCLERSGVPADRHRRVSSPQGIGKTEAEKIIYTVTICAWLAFPSALGAVSSAPAQLRTTYQIVAGVILLGALASVFARTRAPDARQ